MNVKMDRMQHLGGLPSASLGMASLALAMLLASLGASSVNVALPALLQAYQVSFQAGQWVVLAYLLTTTTLIVSAGRLGDATGRRRLLLAGMALFAVASLLCGMAPGFALLIAARAMQGLGAAILMVLALALASETAREQTGRAMGLLATTSALGTALGPSLGGLLLAGPGWRAIFLVNVPLALIALLLAWRWLPADAPARGTAKPGVDLPGTFLLAIVLGAYALSVTIGQGSFGPRNIALLVAAAAGLACFVMVETRAAAPLLPLTLFRDATLRAGLAMSALVSSVMMTTLVVGPFYLSRTLGLDGAALGIAMSVGPLVVACASVPAGRIADNVGAERMTVPGILAMLSGALLASVIPVRFGVAGYLAPIVVITLGYAVFQTANNTTVMSDVPPDLRGVISGMLNLSRNLGLMTGASVLGTLFALAAGTSDIAAARPEAVATGMRTTFAAAAVLMLVALGVAFTGRTQGSHAVSPVVLPHRQ